MRLAILMLGLMPGLAHANPPLTAEAFEAHVTGQTITYRQQDQVFGIEEYLPGRKVRWSVAPGICQHGTWYPEGQAICFVYESDPTPHCWTFWMEAGALAALSTEAEPGAELHETERSATPLSCPGPDVGA
ncbi:MULTISPECIES: hypothetical protein [Tabrizicola]|uniref:hypothetical protein n=1 Tax=Tabrizicola TaxID=1443919 RepID=UPI0010812710|nr:MULTISPECIES: hypothetical protein [Paracoccaceae]